MNFISLTFVFSFPVVVLLYWKISWKYRELFLLAVSYFFYIKESSWAGGLLLLTTAITYLAGIAVEKGRHRRAWLILAVTVCLGFLIGLKYSVPPVGISFYTFQTMAYVIDVYRGEISAEKSPLSYALFVSFFPQLVAGPIERAGNLLGQLKEKHTMRGENLLNGFWLMLRGFYKKVVVADYLAVYVDKVYAAPQDAGGIGAVLGTAFFAVQIYCDFSGYTDIARGAARMMGIRLMENFRHPYRAVSIQDFWKRWHISLTCWFTDYVYIPLGGNRKGTIILVRNIFIVWALTGIWHGANWTFVIWGLMFGIMLIIEKLFLTKHLEKTPSILQRIYVLFTVMISFIIFNANSIREAWNNIIGLFGANGESLINASTVYYLKSYLVVLVIAIIGSTPLLKNIIEKLKTKTNANKIINLLEPIAMTSILIIVTAYLVDNSYNPFLYFRF